MRKNLQKYLRTHPDCELYTGQDMFLTTDEVLSPYNPITLLI